MADFSVSQQELASWLDLSTRRVRELTTIGVLTKGTGGYAVRASVKAYLAFLRSTPGSLTDERARLTCALADMAELKLRQRSGDLVLKAVVEREFFGIARATRDNFLSLPSRTAGLVAAERHQQRCHDILAAEVQQILEGLTNGKADRVRDSSSDRSLAAKGCGMSRYRRSDGHLRRE